MILWTFRVFFSFFWTAKGHVAFWIILKVLNQSIKPEREGRRKGKKRVEEMDDSGNRTR